MIPYMVPTSVVGKEIRGKGERAREVTYQECDLYLPNQRLPMALQVEIKDDPMPLEKHFMSGDDIYTGSRFGPELNRYGVKWIPAKQYYESLTKILKD